MSEKIKDIFNPITSLPTYFIEIGVFSIKSKRREKFKVGLTNAEILFIHENGSPLRNIPARPVLEMTIDWANKNLLSKTIDNAINAYLSSDYDIIRLEVELNKMCIQMENYAREIIYSNDGRLAANSPRVIAKKGENHPLFDTGQLARSITCKLVRG